MNVQLSPVTAAGGTEQFNSGKRVASAFHPGRQEFNSNNGQFCADQPVTLTSACDNAADNTFRVRDNPGVGTGKVPGKLRSLL